MAPYTKAGQIKRLSTMEFCLYKVEKMSCIAFNTVFTSLQGMHEPTYESNK